MAKSGHLFLFIYLFIYFLIFALLTYTHWFGQTLSATEIHIFHRYLNPFSSWIFNIFYRLLKVTDDTSCWNGAIISHFSLNCYKMVCMEDLAYIFSWIKSTNMFPCICNLGSQAFLLKINCYFNIEPHCFHVCVNQRWPQILAAYVRSVRQRKCIWVLSYCHKHTQQQNGIGPISNHLSIPAQYGWY